MLCVVLAALGAGAYLHAAHPTYTAGSEVAIALPNSGASTSGSTSTTAILTGTLDPTVEVQAKPVTAAAFGAGGSKLTALVDSVTGTVTIDAVAPSAAKAVTAADAAASSFMKQRTSDLNAAISALEVPITTFSDQIRAISPTGKIPSSIDAQTTLKVDTAQLQTLSNQQSALRLAAASVRLQQRASASSVTTTNDKKKVIELSLVAGLLAGCGIALARDRFDDTIRKGQEISVLTGKEILAELPTSTTRRPSGTIADTPFDELSESVRELRTALRFFSAERPIQTLLVASGSPGEGKSFVAANLATAWALAGLRVALVSSDLRKPRLETQLGTVQPRHGLSDAIADLMIEMHRSGSAVNGAAPSDATFDIDFDHLLLPTAVDNLLLLPTGPIPPNPAELLGSAGFAKLLGALRSHVDMVVLDSPPVLAVTDAVVMTAQVDAVLFVVSENRTSRAATRRALHLLDIGLAPVLGVVVNRANRRNRVAYYSLPKRHGRWPRRSSVAAYQVEEDQPQVQESS